MYVFHNSHATLTAMGKLGHNHGRSVLCVIVGNQTHAKSVLYMSLENQLFDINICKAL